MEPDDAHEQREALNERDEVERQHLVLSQVDPPHHLREDLEREHEGKRRHERATVEQPNPRSPDPLRDCQQNEQRDSVCDRPMQERPGRVSAARDREHVALKVPQGGDNRTNRDSRQKRGVRALASGSKASRDQDARRNGQERLEDLESERLREGSGKSHVTRCRCTNARI